MSKSNETIDLSKSLGNPKTVTLSTTSDDSEKLEKGKEEVYEELRLIRSVINTSKKELERINEDCKRAENTKKSLLKDLNTLKETDNELIERQKQYENNIDILYQKLNNLEKTETVKTANLQNLDKLILEALSQKRQLEKDCEDLTSNKTALHSAVGKIEQKLLKETELDKRLEEKQKFHQELSKDVKILQKDYIEAETKLANANLVLKKVEIARQQFDIEKETNRVSQEKLKQEVVESKKITAEQTQKEIELNIKAEKLNNYAEELNNQAEQNKFALIEADFYKYEKNVEILNLNKYLILYQNFFTEHFTSPVDMQEIKEIIVQYNTSVVGNIVEPVE